MDYKQLHEWIIDRKATIPQGDIVWNIDHIPNEYHSCVGINYTTKTTHILFAVYEKNKWVPIQWSESLDYIKQLESMEQYMSYKQKAIKLLAISDILSKSRNVGFVQWTSKS